MEEINSKNNDNSKSNNNIFEDKKIKKGYISSKNLIYESYINNIFISQDFNSYNKKINELKKVIKSKSNYNSCILHCLPLNIICIDERKKICGQCALSDIHSNHQIITDDDFIINMELLAELYKEIDNNKDKYLSNNNSLDVKKIIEDINLNINNSIELVNKIKNIIIDNINKQTEKIISFLNKRKNEIEQKYKNNNFEMNNLKESASNWIKNAYKKLNQIMDINESNIDFINIIDEENCKNITYLIRAGKQLKNRFIFVQDSIKIIKNLEEFKNNGLKIEPNFKLINTILNVDNNTYINEKINKDTIHREEKNIYKIENNNEKLKLTIFNIEENYNLIKILHLEQSEFDIIEKEKKEENNYNKDTNEKFKKSENSLINLDEINIDDTLLISPNRTINIHTNPQTTTKLFKNNYEDNKANIMNLDNKNETINNINIKKSNFIITKKIIGLNNLNIHTNNSTIIRETNSFINSENQSNKENKSNNIIKIQIKDNYIKPLCKINTEETLYKSYSRSPLSRRNDNYQSINFINLNNKSNKREKIKVGLNNKMNNYLHKNKEKRNSPKCANRKKNININKNRNLLTKKGSKDKDNLSTLNVSSHNKKNLKISNSKLSLRNHRSKKSFSSLYSEKNIIDLNNNKIVNYDLRKEENNDSFIKLNVFNHYNNFDRKNDENINDSNKKQKEKNMINKEVNINLNKDKNNISVIKSKKDMQKIILSQMKIQAPNFSGINMNGIGIQLICSYLHKNPNNHYKEIKLLGCNISDDDLFILAKTLLDHNINIQILNISNNKISDESASSILDLVKEHRTLRVLSLYNNLISDLLKAKLKEYTELGRKDLHNIELYI